MAYDKVIVYKPDNQLQTRFLAVWKEMFMEIVNCRELIWRLFLRDFQAKYKQSLFGIAWAIINPIITVGVFVFLNRSGIMNIGVIDVPHSVFALLGFCVWIVFSKGLMACTSSIVLAGSMVIKINFPKISLVIASMGQAVVDLLVSILLTVTAFAVYGIVPSKMAMLLPVLILPVFLLTLGLGFFMALLAGLFRDIINLMTLIITYFLFLMPVAYPLPESGILGAVNHWNPLAHIIVGCRQAVLYGSISNLKAYIYSSIFCIVVFLVSWRFFHLVETKIPERV